MRIDDDSFPKQVQQPQPPVQVPSWKSHDPRPIRHKEQPTEPAASSSFSFSNHHRTAGKILLALTALLIVTFIVSSTFLIVGESRSRRTATSKELSRDADLSLRFKRQPPTSPAHSRPRPIDDDEINDAEIYKAVVQSMAEWSKVAKKKEEQKQKQKEREHERLALNPNSTTSTSVILSRQKRDEEIVCYGELGCFRDEGPFDYLDMLPSPPEEVSTKFLLYTRKNLHTPQIYSYFNFTTMLHSHTHPSGPPSVVAPPPPPPPAMSPPAAPTSTASAKSLQNSVAHPLPPPVGPCHFNASHPTKIIIHGFGSTCNQMWASEIRLSILAMTETNVICVDWENGAALPNYVRAAVNTRLVGKQVAMLIFWLNKHFGSDTKDFHLIGFSLGAHVAGFAGQELKNLSRITGLDPAGPLFESYDPKVRLDSSDALFVDVIHSNGDSLLMGGLGSWEPMGHVDFYPNGGRVQKGCSNLFLGAVRDFLWAASDGDGRSLCNHRRAYKFFTESVSPKCSFPAFTCDSYDKFLTGACFSWDSNRCGNMGYYADQMPVQSKGILYLLTREDEPFCANQYRITVESSPSPVPITTYGGLEAVIIGSDYVNETFLITQTVKDSMVAGSVLQKLVVAHPAITEPIQIQLKYTAYQGWLYSGIARWSMDSLIITNAYGKSMSFCTRLLLPNGIPVTIRLTPGICLNRYSEPTGGSGVTPPAGSNAIGAGSGRPQFPPQLQQHGIGYEQFPPTGTEGNVNSITENSTSVHAHNAAAIAADLELSLMKPPRVVLTSGQHQHHSQHSGSGHGHKEEVIGPTYHLTSGPATADWSQWHPVEPPPAWAAKHALLHANRTRYGTPVVLSPASSEEESKTEVSTVTEDTTTVINEETTEPSTTEESPVPTTSTEIPAHEIKIVVPVKESKNATTTEASTNATIASASANLTTTAVPQLPSGEQSKPTDLSLTESVDLPVSIQICHFVDDGSTSTESSVSNGTKRMACIYPQDKLPPAAISESESSPDVMSNNALGQIHTFQHIVETELGNTKPTNETGKTETKLTSPAAATTETEKISVLKQQLHAHGQPAVNGNNNDPEAMPPHLHYILQQLENEGLGPPGGSMVPAQAQAINGNTLGHGGRSLGAAPNYHDNHIQTDFIGGRQAPLLYNPNYHFTPLFPVPQLHIPHDPSHFMPGHPFLQPQPHHGDHGHGRSHSKNPAVMKLHSSSRSSGSGSGGKTPNPSSRALKHRPVALTHGHGVPASGSNGRRPKGIDVSNFNLNPDTQHTAFHHQYNYPAPNAHVHSHSYSRHRTHGHAVVGPMLSLTLQQHPSPSAIPPALPSSIPMQDNVMLASTTNEHASSASAFVPRRIHGTHSAHNMPFRPSRPVVPGGGNTNPKIQQQPPQQLHPPVFYMTNAQGAIQQQPQRHFLFSHVPPREFHHNRRSAGAPAVATAGSSSSSSSQQ